MVVSGSSAFHTFIVCLIPGLPLDRERERERERESRGFERFLTG